MAEVVPITRSGANSLSVAGQALELRRHGATDTIAFAEIQELRFNSGVAIALVIETSRGQHVIRSGAFPMELRAIDAKIRKALPHDRSPDPFAVIPAIKRWEPNRIVRRATIVFGALMFASIVPFAALAGRDIVTLYPVLGILMVAGIALMAAGAIYRGTVTIDRRGVFVARGSSTTFLAWSELDVATLEISNHMLSKELDLRTMKHGRPARVRLRRNIGIGFPLETIQEAMMVAVTRYR